MMRPFDAMMLCVRTTVNIDDTLLREVRSLAAQSGRSLGSVVEDGLRVLLAAHLEARRQAPTFHLPTDGEGGLRPGVDLGDKELLAALLDDEDTRFTDADR
jgi:hypothetical protein